MSNNQGFQNILNLPSTLSSNIKIKHYSYDTFIPAMIIEAPSNNIVCIEPCDSCMIYSYFEDDPIVIVLEENNNVLMFQTYVKQIDFSRNRIKLIINEISDFSNRRTDFRIPTSLNSKLFDKFELEASYISNISFKGFSLLTHATLSLNETIDVETCLSKTPVHFKATVIRSNELSTIFEYGMLTITSDPDNQTIMNILQNDIHISFK